MCDSRCKNMVFVNLCFDQVRRVGSRIESNPDLVLRDQKVPPEVRNQPLLPRECFSHSTFRNSIQISKFMVPAQGYVFMPSTHIKMNNSINQSTALNHITSHQIKLIKSTRLSSTQLQSNELASTQIKLDHEIISNQIESKHPKHQIE